MTDFNLDAVGVRIARFRKLNGLTAEQLADKAGAGLTRSVISNIESGRKAELAMSHLLAISYALGVPPLALVAPLEEPSSVVAVDSQTGREITTRDAIDWFAGKLVTEPTPAGIAVRAALAGIRDYYRSLDAFEVAASRVTRAISAETDSDELSEWSEDLDTKREYLQTLNIDVPAAGLYLLGGSIVRHRQSPIPPEEYDRLLEASPTRPGAEGD